MSSHGLPNETNYRRYSSVINGFFGLTPTTLRLNDRARVIRYARSRIPVSLSLHRRLSLSPPPPFLLPHPHSLPSFSFISPSLDKSKAHIAREQLVSAISDHCCPSQSPSFLQPVFLYFFLYSRRRMNPPCFGKCTDTSTLKAPQSLHFISILHLLSPLSAMLLSHISSLVFFACSFLISLNLSFPLSSGSL